MVPSNSKHSTGNSSITSGQPWPGEHNNNTRARPLGRQPGGPPGTNPKHRMQTRVTQACLTVKKVESRAAQVQLEAHEA